QALYSHKTIDTDIRALVAGGDAVLRGGLRDADPGVRRAAVDGIATLKDGANLEAELLGHDGWPLVRRAAAEGLGASCKGDATVRAALVRAVSGDGGGHGKAMTGADATEEVRRAALASLGRCGDVPLSTFAAVLAEKRQPPSVRELAAALVAKHGGAEAARALAAALDDVLGDPNADERSLGLAVACTRALARTTDTSRPVLEALGHAANEPLSASVRAAAMETIGKLCPDGAAEALHKGAADADPAVKRAARSALERCKK
ncbi:MAG: lyase domain protein repeat-containing protein, partial [Myxococcales bacterium]|nr:lyase domain protein repeat-containing protein [Myxococcales bacterium]